MIRAGGLPFFSLLENKLRLSLKTSISDSRQERKDITRVPHLPFGCVIYSCTSSKHIVLFSLDSPRHQGTFDILHVPVKISSSRTTCARTLSNPSLRYAPERVAQATATLRIQSIQTAAPPFPSFPSLLQG